METEKKNLYAFGYGLALLIPLIVTLHGIDHGLQGWMVIGLFVVVLFTVTRMVLFKPILNGWVLPIQILALVEGTTQGFGSRSFLFLGVSITALLVTIIKVELLKPVYVQWMKVAHLIGATITGVLLSLLFYGVFGIVGIVLRILRKDILNERLEPQAQSYWIKRVKDPHGKKYYEHQF